MSTQFKAFIGIGITVLLVFGIYFLAKPKDPEPSDNSELVKVRVGYIPIADCSQLYIAKEKGFFEKNGLDVELVKLSGGAKILEALIGNSLDVGFSNVVSVMIANNGGVEIRAITGGPRTNIDHIETGLLVRIDSDINKLKDLEGKTIAVNTRKNIVELFVTNYLRKNKVDVTKIKFVEIPFPQMYQVLNSKGVDAVAAIEPFVTFSEESGNIKNLGDYFVSVLPEVELSTYNVKQKFINENPDVVSKFKKAIQEATEFSKDNNDDLLGIIANNTSLSKEQLKNITLPYFGYEVDKNSFNRILELAKKEGWISKSLNSKEIIK